jgi:hypothetical protein
MRPSPGESRKAPDVAGVCPGHVPGNRLLQPGKVPQRGLAGMVLEAEARDGHPLRLPAGLLRCRLASRLISAEAADLIFLARDTRTVHAGRILFEQRVL